MTDNPTHRHYRKSTRSGGSGGNCVEWAHTPRGVYIRDSKDPHGPELFTTELEWQGLIAAAQANVEHMWISRAPGGVHLAKDGHRLRFTAAEWTAFVAAINAGECERVAAAV